VLAPAALTGALLELGGGFVPALNANFRLLDNDGLEALTGMFANLPDGGLITNGPLRLQANYAGGANNNDLVLTVVATNHGAPPNRPPILAAIPDQQADEGVPLEYALAAGDPDAGDQLTFAFVGAVPAGLRVAPATGLISWTPREAQGGATNAVTVQVTDNGSPALSASRTFTVAVREVNQPPQFEPVPDQTVKEGVELELRLVAEDADLPKQNLRFALLQAPAGATLNPDTGRLRFTPDEAQGDTYVLVRVRVQDDASPALGTEVTFPLRITEANEPPTLAPLPTLTGAETGEFVFQVSGTDADVPAQTLTYSLVGNAPAGLTLNPTNGTVRWRPAEADGPGTNAVRLCVTDNGLPARSATATATLIVTEVNAAPVATAPALFTADEGQLLSVMTADFFSDPDVPAQTLTFALVGDPPAGVQLNPANGLVTWTPGENFGGQTNGGINVTATDNGAPARSVNLTLRVHVREVNSPPRPRPYRRRRWPRAAAWTSPWPPS
jgi:hypothetical protein